MLRLNHPLPLVVKKVIIMSVARTFLQGSTGVIACGIRQAMRGASGVEVTALTHVGSSVTHAGPFKRTPITVLRLKKDMAADKRVRGDTAIAGFSESVAAADRALR